MRTFDPPDEVPVMNTFVFWGEMLIMKLLDWLYRRRHSQFCVDLDVWVLEAVSQCRTCLPALILADQSQHQVFYFQPRVQNAQDPPPSPC